MSISEKFRKTEQTEAAKLAGEPEKGQQEGLTVKQILANP
jgi:hypothetical protein